VTAATWGLLLATFFASFVEAVEATTIILAMGLTRSWRSTWYGVATALVALAVVTSAFGYALTTWLPESALQLVIGGLLLVFGLQWLRKAILRSSGFKALHDEEAIFAEEQRAARAAAIDAGGVDWYTFTVSFKGVFLEGLEVAFIVVTFGGAQHNLGLAALGAGAAAIVVLLLGLAVHRPLSQVPENTLKYAVGVMLTTFGIFWAAEGAGIHWPGSDAALIGLLAYVLVTSTLLTAALRRRHARVELRGAVP
jgi:uncharacterized membrane protein